MIIYKATNKTNGMSYIGQTIHSLEHRKKEHIERKGYYFHRAINKYGKENFEWEVLEKFDFKEELDEMEFHYIMQYNSKSPNGYNLTFGGESTHNYKHNKEARKKISATTKGIKKTKEHRKKLSEAHKGKKHSEETLKKLSKINSGSGNPMYGKKHSKETRKKLSEKGKIHNKGERNPMYGKIGENNPNYGKGNKGRQWLITYPDGKEIEINCLSSFGRDYEKETGIKLFVSNLTNVASGKLNHYKGFKCNYLTY